MGHRVDIPAYLDFLDATLIARLHERAEAVPAVPGLRVAPGLRAEFADIETDEALAVVCQVYRAIRDQLREVLEQRQRDRAFIDAETRACVARNQERGRDYLAPDYETVIGKRDVDGRIVVGPRPVGDGAAGTLERVDVPDFLAGYQVTLFGPPDTARMSINAMNALHRRRADEPAVVTRLVEASGQVPRWGADSEDSKTPLMRSLLLANRNLRGCYDGSLSFDDERRGKRYELADSGRALPIKRIPGLALPDGNHIYDGSPLPLHLVDMVLHTWHNRGDERALVFYVPKLENEEEAAYLAAMIQAMEGAIAARDAGFEPGRVRLFVVFENPRAIFRIREMATALGGYFLGGSLGWHDFLASTARLFRHDPGYRIPVKADPDIVIKHIKESHDILVRSLEPMGALAIGGMYGVLFEDGNPDSFRVSMVGFIRDVITQMKRGLHGFWVAHPDFVRIGIALVEAWHRYRAEAGADAAADVDAGADLRELLAALVPDAEYLEPLVAFVFGDDVSGLAEDDPLYLRGVLAADVATSEVIANDHPDEVRYNVFQALQYLCDWLSGNGCVALPALMRDASGQPVFVRVMDDLATTERSRWELWAEVQHGRVSVTDFERMVDEELAFIREDRGTATKRVQVRWQGEAARWYPVAADVLRQLVLEPDPVEFVTELILRYTVERT